MLHHDYGQDSIEEARIGSTDQMDSVGRMHVLDHLMRRSQQGSAIKTESIVAAGQPVVPILAGKEVFEYRLIVPNLVEQVHPALTPSHAVEGSLIGNAPDGGVFFSLKSLTEQIQTLAMNEDKASVASPLHQGIARVELLGIRRQGNAFGRRIG